MKHKKIALIAGAVILAPTILLGQIFGIPQIVYDPAQASNVAVQIQHEIETIRQAEMTYLMITNTYNQIVYNAVWMTRKPNWLGIGTPVVNSATNTSFGETANWTAAVTEGLGVAQSWLNATYAMNPAPFWSGAPIGQSSLSANIASVNVADGLSQAAMTSIANSRMNQPMNDAALTNLETDAQDVTEETNSEVSQLNLVANGAVLQNRQLQDTNALLTTVAEQGILAGKVTRDTIASAINVQSTRDQYIANEATQWGGSAATIAGYQQ